MKWENNKLIVGIKVLGYVEGNVAHWLHGRIDAFDSEIKAKAAVERYVRAFLLEIGHLDALQELRELEFGIVDRPDKSLVGSALALNLSKPMSVSHNLPRVVVFAADCANTTGTNLTELIWSIFR